MLDVLIVGGGIAGLNLARNINKRNKSFMLIEAQENFGGRVSGLKHEGESKCSGHWYADLGATWFWPHQKHIRQLVNELNINTFEQHQSGDVLYQLQPNQPLQRHVGAGSMQSFRFEGGTTRFVQRLLKDVPTSNTLLNTAIIDLIKQGDMWIAHTNNPECVKIEAKSVAFAIPPQQIVSRLNIGSFLTEEGHRLLSQQPTWMAAQAKFVATYGSAFWREQRLSGDAFSRVGPMVEIHDASVEENDGFALFGFIGIPATQRAQLDTKKLSQACLEQFAQLFGENALTPVSFSLNDWQNNHWISSQLDRNAPPRHPEAIAEALYASRLYDTIHFAGSEFAKTEPGYLEGAIEASTRVAASI